jgi:AraC-like DNA-binding protein
MAERKPPIYEDVVGSRNPHYITGTQRFYIDIRYSKHCYLHHHNFAELSFFFEGAGVETVNGFSHRLVPGTVSFVLPHQMHIIKGDSDRHLIKFCCMFDIQLLTDLVEDRWFSQKVYGVGTNTPSYAYFDEEEQARVKDVFTHLLEEYRQFDRPGRLQLIRTKLNEALLLFLRKSLSANADADSPAPVVGDKTRLLWPLLQYVQTHCGEKLNLKELADRFYTSVPYMSRFFKLHVGMGFVEYVHRLRIERAASMLLNTDMTVHDIAFDVGFDNSRTFSRVFREVKGKTATEYRLLALNKHGSKLEEEIIR